MTLPDIVEIVPPQKVAPVLITVPGSKSLTNRALVLGALAAGTTTLRGALWSEDTEIMVEALGTLGFRVSLEADEAEAGNRTITVEGLGGRIPNAGTQGAPLEIEAGNAGTVARFLMPMLCLSGGVYRLSGAPRMHERPQGALFDALRQLGYRVEARDGRWGMIAGCAYAEPFLRPAAITYDSLPMPPRVMEQEYQATELHKGRGTARNVPYATPPEAYRLNP